MSSRIISASCDFVVRVVECLCLCRQRFCRMGNCSKGVLRVGTWPFNDVGRMLVFLCGMKTDVIFSGRCCDAGDLCAIAQNNGETIIRGWKLQAHFAQTIWNMQQQHDAHTCCI